MPTLQKYKKQHAGLIPSVGEGRRQRYKRAALQVFKGLKKESLARRGRGQRRAVAAAPKAVAQSKGRRAQRQDGLLSLQQIQKLTGISYPTLLRYVKLHLAKLAHVGSGRTRRYKPEAVAVFRELRQQSPRGRRAASPGISASTGDGGGSRSMDRRLAGLEKSQAAIERQLREITRMLQRPLSLTVKR